MDKGNVICGEFDQLVSARQPMDQYWESAYEYSLPLRGQRFENKNTDGMSNYQSAQRDKSKIFDSTGQESCVELATTIQSGLVPKQSQWVTFHIPDIPEDEIDSDSKEWLDRAGQRLFTMIHASNFDSIVYEFLLDIVIGGMSGLYVDLEPGYGFRFEQWHLDSMYVKDSRGLGVLDTVYRVMRLTAQQAESRFGKSNLPQALKAALDSGGECDKKYEFIHAVRPRIKGGKQSKGSKLAKNLPWESVYVCRNSQTVVKESGFHEMPVIIPRWLNIPDTEYGVGQFDLALPDVKTLNKIVEMMLINGEMLVAGMYVAKDDGVLNPNTVRIGPRRIIPVANMDNFKQMKVGGDIGFTVNEISRLRQQIRRVMMIDRMDKDKGSMTATEVEVRLEMIRTNLGPIFSRLISEMLDPLIARVFGLALRAGYLGDPPAMLAEYDFVPRYLSPLARAQGREMLSVLERYEASISQVASIDPQALDWYDVDASSRLKATYLAVPEQAKRSETEVKKIRKERQEAAQQQQQMEMMAAQEQQNEG